MDSEWVKQQWQGAELGDERLTQRAIKILWVRTRL